MLNIILRDLINYKGGIINIKTGLDMINFNILLLGSDKAVLEMP